MGECLGRASELHPAADVITATRAVLAGFAGESDLKGNSITRSQGCHIRANGYDCASRLVAKSHGLPDNDVAISVVVEVVKIGAAKTSGLHSDLDFITAGFGDFSFFL